MDHYFGGGRIVISWKYWLGIFTLWLTAFLMVVCSCAHAQPCDPVDRALPLTQQFEGLRLHAYHDVAGYPTIGYGRKLSNARYGPLWHYPPTDSTTALKWLLGGLRAAQQALEEHVSTPLSCSQEAALVDFIYNEGAEAFGKSSLLKRINEGDLGAVPGELLRWDVAADGKVFPGLRRRRLAEIDLWSAQK